MDVLRKIHPSLGLQWVEEPTLPWLRPDRLKVSVGLHPPFGAANWLTVRDESQPAGEGVYRIDLDKLRLGPDTGAHFVFAYRCLKLVESPRAFLAMLREATRPQGAVCVVEQTMDEAIRIGKMQSFDGLMSAEQVCKAIDEAGFTARLAANFKVIGIPHWDEADQAWFGQP